MENKFDTANALKKCFPVLLPMSFLFMKYHRALIFQNTYELFSASFALFLVLFFVCFSPSIHNFTAQGQPQGKGYISVSY